MKIVQGINDLATQNPKLASEWDYDKNEITPSDVGIWSKKKVWWKCQNNHSYETSIFHRSEGTGCPFCCGKLPVVGETDLETLYPEIAKEWHPTKNGIVKPYDVLPFSNKLYWWKCEKGHEWKSTVNNRVKGNGCPLCSAELRTSFPEYAIMYYLINNSIEAIQSYQDYGFELDIYIPSFKIGIEYDGYYWHKDKVEGDIQKNNLCLKNNVFLFRIREEGLPELKSSSKDYFVDKNQSNLSIAIKEIISKILDKSVDVDVDRDRIKIEQLIN